MEPENRTRRIVGRRIRETVLLLAERDGTLCRLCHQPIALQLSGLHAEGPTLEHLTPIALGGTNDLDNLALAHRACNLRRGAKAPDQIGPRSRQW